MKRCDNLVDVGRRQFLSGAGAATAAVAAATLVNAEAKAELPPHLSNILPTDLRASPSSRSTSHST